VPSPGFRLGIIALTLLGLLLPTLLGLTARSLPAQAIGQGFELERAGQLERAASVYFAALRAEPTNLSALLGLERVLPPLSRLSELLPIAQRAAALAGSGNVALRAVLLRTYVGLNEQDSARAVALRWVAAAPDELPPPLFPHPASRRARATARTPSAEKRRPGRRNSTLAGVTLGRPPGRPGTSMPSLPGRAAAQPLFHRP
jgi:hypothetical protein